LDADAGTVEVLVDAAEFCRRPGCRQSRCRWPAPSSRVACRSSSRPCAHRQRGRRSRGSRPRCPRPWWRGHNPRRPPSRRGRCGECL